METASRAVSNIDTSSTRSVDKPDGVFSISLDFELYWGLHDHTEITAAQEKLNSTKKVIPTLLSKFSANGIHATWATVGILFNRQATDLHDRKPHSLPSYVSKAHSPYRISREDLHKYEQCVVAPEIIEKIIESPFQELGSHTYSHYCCLERGQSLTEFKADLEHAQLLASEYSHKFETLVFPRNQYTTAHINVARTLGFKSFRTQQNHWIFEPRPRANENTLVRLVRYLDSFVSVSGKNCIDLPIPVERELAQVSCIPASRFLRPYNQKLEWLNRLHLKRIKKSMTSAAKQGKLYHLWWHPHNFSKNTEKNLENLDAIIQHYSELREKYGFQSMNLSEITEHYSRIKTGSQLVSDFDTTNESH